MIYISLTYTIYICISSHHFRQQKCIKRLAIKHSVTTNVVFEIETHAYKEVRTKGVSNPAGYCSALIQFFLLTKWLCVPNFDFSRLKQSIGIHMCELITFWVSNRSVGMCEKRDLFSSHNFRTKDENSNGFWTSSDDSTVQWTKLWNLLLRANKRYLMCSFGINLVTFDKRTYLS